MSNYPSMSYCAWENTSAAVQQLLSMMRDAGVGEGQKMVLDSRSERAAYRNMRDQLRELMEAMDENDDVEDVEDDEPQD